MPCVPAGSAMLAMSTCTSPLRSCHSWAVPMGAPLRSEMTAVAAETEFPIRCAEEQAPHNAIVTASFNTRDLFGNFIFGSSVGVEFGSLAVADLQSRPEDDRHTAPRSAHVLSRSIVWLINLDGHDFVSVHELIDVARRLGLPRHVVEKVLNAV